MYRKDVAKFKYSCLAFAPTARTSTTQSPRFLQPIKLNTNTLKRQSSMNLHMQQSHTRVFCIFQLAVTQSDNKSRNKACNQACAKQDANALRRGSKQNADALRCGSGNVSDSATKQCVQGAGFGGSCCCCRLLRHLPDNLLNWEIMLLSPDSGIV